MTTTVVVDLNPPEPESAVASRMPEERIAVRSPQPLRGLDRLAQLRLLRVATGSV